jgi:hypothetical protein
MPRFLHSHSRLVTSAVDLPCLWGSQWECFGRAVGHCAAIIAIVQDARLAVPVSLNGCYQRASHVHDKCHFFLYSGRATSSKPRLGCRLTGPSLLQGLESSSSNWWPSRSILRYSLQFDTKSILLRSAPRSRSTTPSIMWSKRDWRST